jgi:hypothetical protein
MHIPVNLNNQIQFIAIEIDDEVLDWNLPAEFQTEGLPVAKQVPCVLLGNSLVLPEFARSLLPKRRESGFVTHVTLTRPPAAVGLSHRERHRATVRPNAAVVTEWDSSY